MNWRYIVPIQGFNYYMRKGLEEDCEKGINSNIRHMKATGLFLYGYFFGLVPVAAPLAVGVIWGVSKTFQVLEKNPIEQREMMETVPQNKSKLNKILNEGIN